MERYLRHYQRYAFALLRIVSGAMFASHGADKVFGAFGHQVPLVSLLGLAGVIELVGGTMIALGVFASWAAFVASGEMAVAYFKAHASQGIWPVANHGELAVLYCFLGLLFATHGPGIWSLHKPKQ